MIFIVSSLFPQSFVPFPFKIIILLSLSLMERDSFSLKQIFTTTDKVNSHSIIIIQGFQFLKARIHLITQLNCWVELSDSSLKLNASRLVVGISEHLANSCAAELSCKSVHTEELNSIDRRLWPSFRLSVKRYHGLCDQIINNAFV